MYGQSWYRFGKAAAGVALLVVCCMLAAAALAAPAGAMSPVGYQLSAVDAPSSGLQLPYVISDNFAGTDVDSALWYVDQGPYNTGTTVGVQNGSLRLTATSAASSGFHDGITTRCQAVGDFDAQIAFTLSNWPADDNVSLAVNANLGNTFVENQVGGDVYGLFVPQPVGFQYITIPASVHTGALMLSRRGNLISAYVRSGPAGKWNQIAAFLGPMSPTFVDVAIWNVSDFGGQPVSVQVNSFKLAAAGLAC